jgi:phage tail sheath protein FI
MIGWSTEAIGRPLLGFDRPEAFFDAEATMTVTTSYPGIYIQELPNLSHTIAPAPTAVTLFIGFAHPYKKDPKVAYGAPVEIFGFGDYREIFGGFFSAGPYFRDDLGPAVSQFFLNGGSHAWVIALEPKGLPSAPTPAQSPAQTWPTPQLDKAQAQQIEAAMANQPANAVQALTDAFSATALTDAVTRYETALKASADAQLQAPTMLAEASAKAIDAAAQELTAASDDLAAQWTVLAAAARADLDTKEAAVTAANDALTPLADALSAANDALTKATNDLNGAGPKPSDQLKKAVADATTAVANAEAAVTAPKAAFDAAQLAYTEEVTALQGLLSVPTQVSFTSKEPVRDQTNSGASGFDMEISIALPHDPNAAQGSQTATSADITITYGPNSEVFRQVPAAKLAATLNQSRLVTVSGNASSFSSIPPTPFTYTQPVPQQAMCSLSLNSFQGIFDPPTKTGDRQGVARVPIFNLMCLPGVTGSNPAERAVMQIALACCENSRAILILDTPAQVEDLLGASPGNFVTIDTTNVRDYFEQAGLASTNGAIFFPHLTTVDPITLQPSESPPCGFVAGAFARQDAQNGVWTTAAGYQALLKGVSNGVVVNGRMSDPEQGTLNPHGINCIRGFPDSGTVIFGGRTLVAGNTAFEQWKYIAVRRMALFLEDSLYDSLGWAIFQPNWSPLWTALKTEVDAFMSGLYRNNAFAGDKPTDAYRVVCDRTTTTQADIENGIVNILVAFAPLKPAEFVVVKIAQLTGQATV